MSSYQLLYLLNIAEKLLYQVICTMLERVIDATGELVNNQFGFKKVQSRIDAISRIDDDDVNAAISGSQCAKSMCPVIAVDIFNLACRD